MTLLIPASAGELVDKITVLEIKLQNISDIEKRATITAEFVRLEAICEAHLVQSDALTALRMELGACNARIFKLLEIITSLEEGATLWHDDAHDALEDVFMLNRHRFEIKSKISALCPTETTEVKSYL